jgi:membrane protease YdiL (CAAX protease family)
MTEPIPPRPDLTPGPPGPDRAHRGLSDPSIPRATWKWYEAILVGLIGFVGGGIIGALLAAPFQSHQIQNALLGLGTDIGLAGAVALWLYTSHRAAIPALRLDVHRPKELLYGIGGGLAIYAIAVLGIGPLIVEALRAVSGRSSVRTPRQIPAHLHGVGLLLTAVFTLVTAPFAEELFFRGFLFRSLRDRHGFLFSGIVSALAFGAVHYRPSPWQNTILLIVVICFVGFGLAYVYERRGSLLANMAAHATFNAIGFALILSKLA